MINRSDGHKVTIRRRAEAQNTRTRRERDPSVQHRSRESMDASGPAESSLAIAGALGGAAVLGSMVAGQTVGAWSVLAFGLLFVWQFAVHRDSRGRAGAPGLQRVNVSTEHSLIDGRRRS